jgi:CSLREA domain-containing protein
MPKRLIHFGISGLLLVLIVSAANSAAQVQSSADYVVTLSADESDANPGDGVCLSVPSAGCSLRAAVEESNRLPGSDSITFAITGTLVLTHSLAITDSVNILGPGADQLTLYGSASPGYLSVAFGKAGGQFSLSDVRVSGTDHMTGIIVTNGALALTRVTIEGLRNQFGNGGLVVFSANASATVHNSTFNDNKYGPAGGGMYILDGTLNLVNSTVSNNLASYYGGGIYNNGGTANIIGSTIVSNTLTGQNIGGDGGGIYNSGDMTVANTTISDNIVNGTADSDGGGLANTGTLTLTISTLSHNSNTTGQGGGLSVLSGTVLVRNTIIANSLAGADCVVKSGSLADGGNNLVEDNSCGFAGGADPLLGPLADNGGPTLTRALLPGSPAVDAGNPAGCLGGAGIVLNTDQRGFFRPADGDTNGSHICDIGAFELGALAPTNWLYLPLALR